MPSDEHVMLINKNGRCKTDCANAGRDLPDLFFRMRACVPRVRSDLADGYDRVSVRHDIPPLAGARALAAAQSATSCNYGVNRSGAIVNARDPHTSPLRVAGSGDTPAKGRPVRFRMVLDNTVVGHAPQSA